MIKRVVWLCLRLFLVVGLLGWLIQRTGVERILMAFGSAHMLPILVAAGLFFISILLGAWQWHLLLLWQKIQLPFSATFKTYYSGLFLNNFLPGTVGGDVLRVVVVKRQSEDSLGKVMAATFVDRVMGFLALSLLSVLALLLERFRGVLEAPVFRHLLLASLTVNTLFLALIIVLLSRRIAAGVHDLVKLTPWPRLDSYYRKIQDQVMAYRGIYRRQMGLLGVALLVQVLRIGVHWGCAIALGLAVPPAFFFCFIPIIALAGVVPLNVGGWGIPQSLGAWLYLRPGVLPATTLDAGAAAAALAFLPSLVGLVVMLGGGFYLVVGRSQTVFSRINPGD